MELTAQTVPTITVDGNLYEVRVPASDKFITCKAFKIGAFYMVATLESYDRLQRLFVEHARVTHDHRLRGGGIPTYDPNFPSHNDTVLYLCDEQGVHVHEKDDLIALLESKRYQFQKVASRRGMLSGNS